MLSPLSVPNKKATPEQQFALMRNYINQLKDDAEAENYNITWEKLAKPLKEKIEGLDRDLVNLSDTTGVILANYVGVDYLEANYITAQQIAADYIAANMLDSYLINSVYLTTQYVYAGAIDAGQIHSGVIAAQYLDSKVITTDTLGAKTIYCDQIAVRSNQKINGDKLTQINGDTITTGRISSSLIDTSTLQFNGLKYTNGSWSITLTLQRVQKYGGGEAWCLGAASIPS